MRSITNRQGIAHQILVLQTPGTNTQHRYRYKECERNNAKGVGATKCTSWRNGVAAWGTLLSRRIPRYSCNRAGRYCGRVSREHAARPSCNQAHHSPLWCNGSGRGYPYLHPRVAVGLDARRIKANELRAHEERRLSTATIQNIF